jgi:hypothetical protein
MTIYTVKRQDDNGHVFEVERFDHRQDAEQLCKELTDKGHKQMYWVEEKGSSPSLRPKLSLSTTG